MLALKANAGLFKARDARIRDTRAIMLFPHTDSTMRSRRVQFRVDDIMRHKYRDCRDSARSSDQYHRSNTPCILPAFLVFSLADRQISPGEGRSSPRSTASRRVLSNYTAIPKQLANYSLPISSSSPNERAGIDHFVRRRKLEILGECSPPPEIYRRRTCASVFTPTSG